MPQKHEDEDSSSRVKLAVDPFHALWPASQERLAEIKQAILHKPNEDPYLGGVAQACCRRFESLP